MNKFLTTLLAGAFALSLGTATFAADATKTVDPVKAETAAPAEHATKAAPAKHVKKHHAKKHHAKHAHKAVKAAPNAAADAMISK